MTQSEVHTIFAEATEEELDRPRTMEFGTAIAFLSALGRDDIIGAGTVESPWFPIEVTLFNTPGVDGNSLSIINRVERDVRAYLRGTDLEKQWRDPVLKALAPELRSSHSYGEFIERVLRMVHVR